MRSIALAVTILLTLSTMSYAHGGKSHDIMGTVKMVHEDHLIVKATDGREVTIHMTKNTKFSKGSKWASRNDLKAGARVVVHTTEDGKAAVTVKIGIAKAK
ncbi:MAG TPA: hypothetical protein VGS96_07165 [Thermoanaerobaculia bacterium]|nr:hypothetical protein [Thermoanaerobaculia bacterium]